MDQQLTTSRTQNFNRPRLEYKYVAPIELVQRFMRSLDGMVDVDQNATDGRYRVSSLYYDSPDLKAYWEKIDGEDPRYKLRARYYRPLPTDETAILSPPETVYVEAKHRHDQLVSKSRVSVKADRLNLESQSVLAPGLRELVNENDVDAALELDRLLLDRVHSPWVVASYTRQPFFLQHDDNVRITIDTDLRALSPSQFPSSRPGEGLSILPAHMAVVEVKFFWAMPHWLAASAVQHGLQLRRYSKYASALEALYPHHTVREMRLASWNQYRE